MAVRFPLVFLFCALVAARSLAVEPIRNPSAAAPLGTHIKDLRFTDIRGLQRNLQELGSHEAIVFAFTTTTCPLVRKSFKLIELDAEFRSQGVLFVAVNVGGRRTPCGRWPLRRWTTSTFLLCQGYGQFVRGRWGARVEVVVLDSQHTIRYRGRIDDQLRESVA